MTQELHKKFQKEQEKEKKDIINLYNKLYKEKLIWFVLGGLISSDSFIEVPKDLIPEAYKLHIQKLKDILSYIPQTNIPDEDKEKIIDFINKGIQLLTTKLNNINKII